MPEEPEPPFPVDEKLKTLAYQFQGPRALTQQFILVSIGFNALLASKGAIWAVGLRREALSVSTSRSLNCGRASLLLIHLGSRGLPEQMALRQLFARGRVLPPRPLREARRAQNPRGKPPEVAKGGWWGGVGG